MALLRTVLFVGQEFGILPLISQSSAPEEWQSPLLVITTEAEARQRRSRIGSTYPVRCSPMRTPTREAHGTKLWHFSVYCTMQYRSTMDIGTDADLIRELEISLKSQDKIIYRLPLSKWKAFAFCSTHRVPVRASCQTHYSLASITCSSSKNAHFLIISHNWQRNSKIYVSSAAPTPWKLVILLSAWSSSLGWAGNLCSPN